MAALIALALFVAQAFNFGLALRDRRAFRLGQATRPVATRIADALERETQGGRQILSDRGRVRRAGADPVPPSALRNPEVASELRRQLAENDVPVGRIDAGFVRAMRENDDRRDRSMQMLVIGVEQPGRGWLVVNVPWPEAGARLLVALALQTLILYAVILLPVLWIARRISRPLGRLTAAAGSFDPTTAPDPVPAEGPSDIRQLVAAFNELRLRVTAMLDEKDRMLGAIGHDLRTPLAAMRVRIESVEDETDRARLADTIGEMSRTLDDILSLARIGRSNEPLVEVDLSALVDAVVEDFRDLGQPIEFLDSPRLPLRLRAGLMRRAVRNLIENAVKYGGSATVRVEEIAGEVLIIVADQGPGIPSARTTAVFEPFTRLEESRNRDTGGVGLGLTLARSIVRDAGGDIRLANRPERGLDATIILPR